MSFVLVGSPIPTAMTGFTSGYETIEEEDSKALSYSNTVRGKLGIKSVIENNKGISRTSPYVLVFQFNPEEIEDLKRNRWEMRQYAGRMGIDPIWIGGDTRTILFRLTLDATAGSVYTWSGGTYTPPSPSVKGQQPSVVRSQVKRMLDERGVLTQTELLQSFQYPASQVSDDIFVGGMAKRTKQFMYPPDLVFSYGNYYLTCKMIELSIRHILFNKNLIPIRSEVALSLVVKEEESELIDTSLQTGTSITDRDKIAKGI